MECQAALAEPGEGGALRLVAGTQSLDAVQLEVAQVGPRRCACSWESALDAMALLRLSLVEHRVLADRGTTPPCRCCKCPCTR